MAISKNKIFPILIILFLLVASAKAEEAAVEKEVALERIVVFGQRVELFSGKVRRERINELQPTDIGDLLRKDVEGIGANRKSGIALDPVLRGLSKDRLNVLVDGGFLFGACPNRMDPPTFHITPYEIEGVEIAKGPFDVTLGPGGLGGIINIETKRPEYNEKLELHSEVRTGFDSVAEGLKGGVSLRGGQVPFGFILSYDYRDYNGYRDGGDNRITADFKQQNFTTSVDYFIEEDKKIGISYIGQRGDKTSYPVLGMDSPRDDMDMVSLSMDFKDLSAFVNSLDVRFYSNWVEHLMDNFSKFSYTNSTPTMNAETLAKSRTYGGKVKVGLALMDGTDLGVDYYNRWWNSTRKRWMLSGMSMSDIRDLPDTTVQGIGVFIQPTKKFGDFVLTTGIRIDFVDAEAEAVGATEAGYFDTYYGSGASSNLNKTETNIAGFLKGGYSITEEVDIYAGLGRGVRTADSKERFRILAPIHGGKYSIGNPNLEPEENFQFEIGSTARFSRLHYNVSVFHNSIKDFITEFDTGMTFTGRTVMGYKNVDAKLYGGEFSASFLITENISLIGSTSYTWGENKDDHKPLPEILPWERRLGVRYDQISGKYWVELMGRFVSGQHRYDPSVDPGTTSGFSTFDLKLGWKSSENMSLAVGIENIFDRFYCEHTSKNFAYNQDGYTTTDRLPEPGRNVYVNLTWIF